GIITDAVHGKARIVDVTPERVREALDEGRVVIVAGFQGVSRDTKDITTLGRGGSDTTAVAFAAAFDAVRCDIYTDVDGVYTTDPRITKKARKLDRISYEEMLELASLGAKVLQTRSVELAMRYKVRLRVLSSFEEVTETSGTLVCAEEDIMESKAVVGVAHSREEAKITLFTIEDRPGIAAAIFGPLAEAGVNVDMIVQNISEKDYDEAHPGAVTDMTFSCPVDQVPRARRAMEEARARGAINYDDLIIDDDVAKVSVVGIGMRSHTGVAARMFTTLAREGINIKVISTSEIKISVLIDRKYMELAVQALHDAFALEGAGRS
ncbi:MAG: aspartate kinase, partial [Gemmobacter sp.]